MQRGEYQSIERVLLLLILLNTAPAEGYSREEIFAQITLYDSKSAMARLFERDLAVLGKIGFTVERMRKGRKGACYRIIHAEHVIMCPWQGPAGDLTV